PGRAVGAAARRAVPPADHPGGARRRDDPLRFRRPGLARAVHRAPVGLRDRAAPVDGDPGGARARRDRARHRRGGPEDPAAGAGDRQTHRRTHGRRTARQDRRPDRGPGRRGDCGRTGRRRGARAGGGRPGGAGLRGEGRREGDRRRGRRGAGRRCGHPAAHRAVDARDRTMTGPDADDFLNPGAFGGEGDTETGLRPSTLDEFIGQPKVVEQLRLVLAGATGRGATPDHILLSGPPGLGKTSLAMIVAAELGTALRVTSGPALERAGDLAAMLSNLVDGDVLFIDEIHRIARPAEEMLYLAMEDFRVDVVVGKGPGATSIPLDVAPFTLVGATTRSGALTGPLRDRFGFTAHMDYYEPVELERVLRRSAEILGVDLQPSAGAEIARRSRGTPRIANRLLRRVRDYA